MSSLGKLGRLLPLRYRVVQPASEVDLGAIADAPAGYHPANPSLERFGERYVANIRCVNYRLLGERTLKSRFTSGEDWDTANRVLSWSDDPGQATLHQSLSDTLAGIEDIRFAAIGDRLYASGTCYREGTCGMALFTFARSLDLLDHRVLPSPFGFAQEKNWAPFERDGKLCFVYALDPLIILQCSDAPSGYDMLYGADHDAADLSFHIGGSSQGIRWQGGWLFVFHKRRVQPFLSGTIYVHYFVWISPDFRIVRKGAPFVIGRSAVHFVGGMVAGDDSLLISYGRADSSALLARFAVADLPIPAP